MSKVESFYWNKLSNKSFSFESEQFFICAVFQLFRGVACITSSIYHCCVVRQKEVSRKFGMSKVESFSGIDSAITAFLLNKSSFLICVLFQLFRGVACIT